MTTPETLTYEVFVSDQPRQDNGLLPNGQPKGDASVASTLIGNDKRSCFRRMSWEPQTL